MDHFSADRFPLYLTLRTDWSELDYFGHVNNLAYYKYMQASRMNFFDHIGLTRHHLDTNVGPIQAAGSCQFKRQLHYPGQVTVYVRTAWVKNSSFALEHYLVNEAGEVAAIGEEVIVYFDFNQQQKQPLSEPFRSAIEALSGQ